MNLQNAGEFIKAGCAAIAAGGELVDKKAVAEKKFSVIAENARKFVAEVKKGAGKGVKKFVSVSVSDRGKIPRVLTLTSLLFNRYRPFRRLLLRVAHFCG